MAFSLERLELGPWPMNCYLLRCSDTGDVAIVDPGDEADAILAAAGGAVVCCILLTHAHRDHVGALSAVRQATGAPVGLHPADAQTYGVEGDFPLIDGMEIHIGQQLLGVLHVPGHTAGSVCLRYDSHALVGDAIFPGGPGHTATPEALAQSLASLGRVVFSWPDDIVLHPGHGGDTTVGAEREAFERFVASDHPAGLCGDVTWG